MILSPGDIELMVAYPIIHFTNNTNYSNLIFEIFNTYNYNLLNIVLNFCTYYKKQLVIIIVHIV